MKSDSRGIDIVIASSYRVSDSFEGPCMHGLDEQTKDVCSYLSPEQRVRLDHLCRLSRISPSLVQFVVRCPVPG